MKLLPCPHCGSMNLHGPHLTDYIGDTYSSPQWWVECIDCPAEMAAEGETADALISAWNRRTVLDEYVAIKKRADIVGSANHAPEAEYVCCGFYHPCRGRCAVVDSK